MFATLAQPEFDKVSETSSADRFRLLAERLEKALTEIENARLMVMGSLIRHDQDRTADERRHEDPHGAQRGPAAGARRGRDPRDELPSVVPSAGSCSGSIAGMVALGVGILAFARRKKWI